MVNKHTYEDLKTLQSRTLQGKIQLTQTRIMEFYERFNGNVYISFSGGLDSTVLLDMARRMYEQIPAVFADTGLEYPEIRQFALSQENVDVVRPLKYDKASRKWVATNFREVLTSYGYPVVSKEVSECIEQGRVALKNGKYPYRLQKLNGTALQKDGTKSKFQQKKWRYLLDSPFKISPRCCDVMKKNPFKQYSKQTGRYPIVGTMADESRLRHQQWLQHGCNAFDTKKPISKPMSFWTKQNVLQYIKISGIQYASIYGASIR